MFKNSRKRLPLIRKVFVAFEITRGVKIVEAAHVVKLDRPIMFPDVIGEHCLILNAELLLKSHDSTFLRLILESNEKWKEEIKDENVRREVEKTKKRVNDMIRNLSLFNKSI
jgi:hypothetical protein